MGSYDIESILSGSVRFKWTPRNTTVGQYVGEYAKEYRLDPPYQRGDVWTEAQRAEFVRAVLAGVPFPPVVVNRIPDRRSDGVHWFNVIDGRQRLTAVRMFRDGLLEVDGRSYGDLPENWKRKFANALFPCVETSFDTEEEEAEYYRTFNFSGTPHDRNPIP